MNVTVASYNFANAPKNTVLKKVASLSKTNEYNIILKLGLRGLNVAFASQGCALSKFLLLILGIEFTSLECCLVEYGSHQGLRKSLNSLRT